MSDKDHDGKASPERGPFLARWSKRKIDNTRRTLPDKSSQLPPAHQADSTIEQPFDPKAFELPVPELEDIVAGFDMRPFLQKGTGLRAADRRSRFDKPDGKPVQPRPPRQNPAGTPRANTNAAIPADGDTPRLTANAPSRPSSRGTCRTDTNRSE